MNASIDAALALIAANEKLASQVAELEQLVCDFQASALLDVGGVGDPSEVKPGHVEAEITRLRTENDRMKEALGTLRTHGIQPFTHHNRSTVGTVEDCKRTLDELDCFTKSFAKCALGEITHEAAFLEMFAYRPTDSAE